MTQIFASFYRSSDRRDGAPDVHEVLLRLADNPDVATRERALSRDLVLRLERLENEGDFICGEFCRKQTDNIPPRAGPNGLNEIDLGEGHGFGYLAAFRYHLPTRVLLLEKNKMSASSIRLATYLKRVDPAADFAFSQILRRDAWDRLQRGNVRRFKVALASPRNLEALEAQGLSAAGSAKHLADVFEGVTVNFEVGMGRDKTANLDKNMVERAAEWFMGAADVRKVTAVISDDDGSSILDFTGDCLKVSESIDRVAAGIPGRYQARADFLSRSFDANLGYLEELYQI